MSPATYLQLLSPHPLPVSPQFYRKVLRMQETERGTTAEFSFVSLCHPQPDHNEVAVRFERATSRLFCSSLTSETRCPEAAFTYAIVSL